MAFPTTGGKPSLSGGMIPKLFASTLLVSFYISSVLPAIANTDYEGMISKMGDEVNINARPDLTISDYQIGQNLTYPNPEPAKQSLLIDKGKSWSFATSDVDVVQSNIDFVPLWADEGGQQLKIAVDADVLQNIPSDAHADNAGDDSGAISGGFTLGKAGTPLAFTSALATDIIVDAGSVLDEQNVPETGRFMVLPAWAIGMVKKSDLQDASLAGDGTSILRNGRVGMIDRFEVFLSNNLLYNTSDAAHSAIFGHKTGITFASQIVQVETLKNPNDFGDLHRGLQVYGYKVVKPEALGVLYIDKS